MPAERVSVWHIGSGDWRHGAAVWRPAAAACYGLSRRLRKLFGKSILSGGAVVSFSPREVRPCSRSSDGVDHVRTLRSQHAYSCATDLMRWPRATAMRFRAFQLSKSPAIGLPCCSSSA